MNRSILLAMAISIGATTVSAETMTFGASADARVINLFGGSNFGTDFLSVFRASGNLQNTMIKFDIGGIPGGQTVTNATLRLYGTTFSGPSTDPTTISVFRLTDPFVESEVTWNSRSTGVPWSTAGGSFVGQTGVQGVNPYATYNGTQPTQWYEWDVTSLVAEWNAGVHANHGFALTSVDNTYLTFTSREGLSHAGIGAQFRPELVVDYRPIPEPGTLAMLGIGLLALRRKRK